MNERKEAVKILAKFMTRWESLADPLRSSWLFFDICVSRTNGEDTLPSCHSIRAGLIAIVKVDPEDLGDAIADSVRHGSTGPEGDGPGGYWSRYFNTGRIPRAYLPFQGRDEKTRPTRLDKLPQKVCQGLKLMYQKGQAVGCVEAPCGKSTYSE